MELLDKSVHASHSSNIKAMNTYQSLLFQMIDTGIGLEDLESIRFKSFDMN